MNSRVPPTQCHRRYVGLCQRMAHILNNTSLFQTAMEMAHVWLPPAPLQSLSSVAYKHTYFINYCIQALVRASSIQEMRLELYARVGNYLPIKVLGYMSERWHSSQRERPSKRRATIRKQYSSFCISIVRVLVAIKCLYVASRLMRLRVRCAFVRAHFVSLMALVKGGNIYNI